MRRISATAATSYRPLADGCGAATDRRINPTVPPSAAKTTADPTRADADLILTMDDDISTAFQTNPDSWVRTMIAYQYRDDLADVDFARCVTAIEPGATTLRPTKKLHFDPNITTMSPDPGSTLTSDRGRIDATAVAITDDTKPTVHQRHRVILTGNADQFSGC